jgi:hypothetical protein
VSRVGKRASSEDTLCLLVGHQSPSAEGNSPNLVITNKIVEMPTRYAYKAAELAYTVRHPGRFVLYFRG